MSDALLTDLPSFDEAAPPRESLLDLPSLDGEAGAEPSQSDMPGLMELNPFEAEPEQAFDPFAMDPAPLPDELSQAEGPDLHFDDPLAVPGEEIAVGPDMDAELAPAEAAPLELDGGEPMLEGMPLQPELTEHDQIEALAEDHVPEPTINEPEAVEAASIDAASQQIDALLEQLTQGLQAFEAQAAEHVLGVTQHMARDLFPALTDAFLAHEFVQHLPAILPRMTPDVVITVPEACLPLVDAALTKLPVQQSMNCSVQAGETSDFSIVWPSGGYDFAFDALFDVCRQRLGIDRPKNEESQDD